MAGLGPTDLAQQDPPDLTGTGLLVVPHLLMELAAVDLRPALQQSGAGQQAVLHRRRVGLTGAFQHADPRRELHSPGDRVSVSDLPIAGSLLDPVTNAM